MGMLKKMICQSIRAYQYVLSPLTGPRCRFDPTCSQYALQVFSRFNLVKACFLALKRLVKCHPLHPGGQDKPPE